jgi:hypothetical protein
MRRIIFFCLLVFHSFYGFALQQNNDKTLSINQRQAGMLPYTLLELVHWDEDYQIAREKDVDIIFDNIDQAALLRNISDDHRRTIISLLKKQMINQLIQDRDFFKKELVKQYMEFFTPDELATLTQYFRTSLMQAMIMAKATNKTITRAEIEDKFQNLNPEEEQVVNAFNRTYLKARFERFQEKMALYIGEKVKNRMQQIFDAEIKSLPETIANYNNANSHS